MENTMVVPLLLLSWSALQSSAQTASTAAMGSAIPASNVPATTSQNAIVGPANFQRANLTAVNPLAVCNDGSPGFYFFRPGTRNGTTKWVIRFEGGGFCSDQLTCTFRALATPNLMSSSSQYFPDILQGNGLGGVLDGDVRANPYMNTWNHVSVGYCSSDVFLGNTGPNDTPETGIYQFRGQHIVNATVNSLLAARNLKSATDILIVGASAGAVGVLNAADGIYSIIKPAAPALVNYKAFVDAGWFLDLPSYSQAPSAFTFRKTAIGYSNNFKAGYNPSCAAAYPSQPWACFFASYAWAYVKTPVIFHEFLYDGANLGYDAAGSQNNINDFRSKMTAAVTTPANAVPTVRNGASAPSAPSAVTLQSFSAVMSPQSSSGAPSSPTVQNSQDGVSSIVPTSSQAMQGVPPAATQSLPGLQLQASAPPSPALPSQTTNASGLPTATGLIGTATLPAVFAPACNQHTISDSLLFSVSHVGMTRFTDVLNTWFTTGRAGLPLLDPTAGVAAAQACLRAV